MQEAHDLEKALSIVCNQNKLKIMDRRLIWGLISNKPFVIKDEEPDSAKTLKPQRKIIKRKNHSERIKMMKGNGEDTSQEKSSE